MINLSKDQGDSIKFDSGMLKNLGLGWKQG